MPAYSAKVSKAIQVYTIDIEHYTRDSSRQVLVHYHDALSRIICTTGRRTHLFVDLIRIIDEHEQI